MVPRGEAGECRSVAARKGGEGGECGEGVERGLEEVTYDFIKFRNCNNLHSCPSQIHRSGVQWRPQTYGCPGQL